MALSVPVGKRFHPQIAWRLGRSGCKAVAVLRQMARAFAIAATTVVTVATFTVAGLIVVLHIGFRPILSGSMRPTFGPGWAVVTRPLATSRLRPGDIILFVPPGHSQAFAHRVLTVSGPPDAPVVTTRGDANPTIDPWRARITSTHVTQVVGALPPLGQLMLDVEHRTVRVVLIVLVGAVVAVTGTRRILRLPPAAEPGPQERGAGPVTVRRAP